MASAHFDDPCFYCSSATPTGGFFTGGAQVGYNYQLGAGLIGIEADVSGNSKFKSSVIGGGDTFSMTVNAKADVSGTLRARAGVVVGNALAYVMGGAAWADVAQTGSWPCQHKLLAWHWPSRRPNRQPKWHALGRSDWRRRRVPPSALTGRWAVNSCTRCIRTVMQELSTPLRNSVRLHSPRRKLLRHPSSKLTTDVARLRINYKPALPRKPIRRGLAGPVADRGSGRHGSIKRRFGAAASCQSSQLCSLGQRQPAGFHRA